MASLMKMKRKDLDDVSSEFSEFSLSAPAKKIRRLDADFTPIVEEELPDIPPQLNKFSPHFGASNGFQQRLSEPVIEELPPSPENEERAIVLFNPRSSPHMSSAPTFFIHSDLVSSIKNRGIWRADSICNLSAENEESKDDKNLAVVPWVPSQKFRHRVTSDDNAFKPEDLPEPMDSDEMETEQAMLDGEDNTTWSNDQMQAIECNNMMSNDGMAQHWQQPHCMIPQLPQNMSSPVVWYR